MVICFTCGYCGNVYTSFKTFAYHFEVELKRLEGTWWIRKSKTLGTESRSP